MYFMSIYLPFEPRVYHTMQFTPYISMRAELNFINK